MLDLSVYEKLRNERGQIDVVKSFWLNSIEKEDGRRVSTSFPKICELHSMQKQINPCTAWVAALGRNTFENWQNHYFFFFWDTLNYSNTEFLRKITVYINANFLHRVEQLNNRIIKGNKVMRNYWERKIGRNWFLEALDLTWLCPPHQKMFPRSKIRSRGNERCL